VRRETEPMYDVVQAALQDRQQLLAGVLRRARGQLKIAAELALEDAVEALELLLFAEANAILAGLAAALAVHAGREIAALDGALGAFAAAALEEQLDAFTATQFANRIEMTSHKSVEGIRVSGSGKNYTRR